MWVVYMQVWKMSSSAWNSELQQEGIEHQLPNDYLVSLSPWVFNYGAELELPRVCLVVYRLCITAITLTHFRQLVMLYSSTCWLFTYFMLIWLKHIDL